MSPAAVPLVAALHDEAQDREPHRMAERAELLGVAFEFRGHAILLTFSNQSARGISSIVEPKGEAGDLRGETGRAP